MGKESEPGSCARNSKDITSAPKSTEIMGNPAGKIFPSFLVVGCGSIGRRHACNLLSLGAREIAVFDASRERRKQLASELGVDTVENLEQGWEHKPDVVIIALP